MHWLNYMIKMSFIRVFLFSVAARKLKTMYMGSIWFLLSRFGLDSRPFSMVILSPSWQKLVLEAVGGGEAGAKSSYSF